MISRELPNEYVIDVKHIYYPLQLGSTKGAEPDVHIYLMYTLLQLIMCQTQG